MSVASKLLGTPSHQDMAALRENAQVRASEDAQRIRELERQLRETQGQAGDRGRQLDVAKERVKELEDRLGQVEQLGLEREWQMEQLRERARQMLKLALASTQAVQGDAGQPVAVAPGTDIRNGLPRDALLQQEQQDR